ncbi:sulfite exporter TauE/SafE family protein [Tersicoccus sp. MR15.9]|uniref:sulfite exporter TauE/SafE family protein n=1 Tax=Tersicoccus mangrovi TaxID=3121635 RepID=UPI002FE63522
MTVTFTLLLSVLIGLLLGLLGGGGSILTIPVLTWVAGFAPAQAITASLVVVGATSAVSVIAHARAGRVAWRTGLLFGAAGVLGAFGGGLLGRLIPGTVLMILFALMMLVTSIAMIRGRRGGAGTTADPTRRRVPLVLAVGLGVGVLTGLVGAGGGFMIVPALTLLAGLSMPQAVGTSLLVITVNSAAGLAGHLTSSATLNWPLVGAVTLVAIAGSLVGARLVNRIPAAALRRWFGVFVLAMGVLVMAQNLPGATGLAFAGVAVALAAGAVVCWFAVARCPLRRTVTA